MVGKSVAARGKQPVRAGAETGRRRGMRDADLHEDPRTSLAARGLSRESLPPQGEIAVEEKIFCARLVRAAKTFLDTMEAVRH